MIASTRQLRYVEKIGLPAGAWLDRLDPRAVMITADLVSAATLASVPLCWWLGFLTLPQLLIVALLGGAATVFFRTAHVNPLKAIDAFGVGSGDIDARDVKAQEAAEGCAEYERPQEYRQCR